MEITNSSWQNLSLTGALKKSIYQLCFISKTGHLCFHIEMEREGRGVRKRERARERERERQIDRQTDSQERLAT